MDSHASEASVLLNKLQHIGGQLHGWNYCVSCKKNQSKLLHFISCEHRMCIPCMGGEPKSTAFVCPTCDKSSTLQEPSKRLIRIISQINKSILNVQPGSDKLNPTKRNRVSNVECHTTQRLGRRPKYDKRNAKGETKLQIACITNDLAQVKALIAGGADVNAQDNTGWTSLHESAFYGYYEIAVALLEAGALVDVPGEMNTTPLHDAVYNNQPKLAKLLINYGANTQSRDSKGQRPIDLTKEKEMKTLLATASVSPEVQTSSRKTLTNSAVWDASSVLLMAAGDQKEFDNQLKAFAKQFKLKISNSYSEKVTHVVTMANDGVCKVSFQILQAILGGKTIVSDLWIKNCMEAEKLVDPLPFEVKGTEKFPSSLAPKRSRYNATSKSPGLFNGCNIYLRHTTCKYKAGELALSKDGFVQLIRLGGGKVLAREPKTDGETETNVQMPFHATPDGPLAKCSHYIIRWAGDERIQYNMEHVKTLPVEWFIESIENFRLLDSFGYL